MKDTIFAQSSGHGKAGISVFRLSGAKSMMALKQLTGVKNSFYPKPRMMYYKKIYDPKNMELIDHAMLVYFKAPASFTGEDIVEIYTHGSIAISKLLHSALGEIEGLRLAEAGEFAKRAFLNNKFDLTSAEGLADLIEAETLWQHRQATKQWGGALEKLYNQWREQLLTIISLLEAYIDFPDEDIPTAVLANVLTTTEKLKNDIAFHLADNRRGEILRSGLKLTIVGHPNVGKSSLLNFLMQREVAIVSNIAGTTRDIIEGHLDMGGYPVIIQDTAGIRSGSRDIIEKEGIKRAMEAAKNADIKIVILDALSKEGLTHEVLELIDDTTILVVNKIDLLEDLQALPANTIKISVKNRIGLNELLDKIILIAGNIAGMSEQPAITRTRHRRQLQQALQHLLQFDLQKDLVLATEDVRMAIRALSNIMGDITVDEILGEIFSNFCIGK